MRDLLTSGFEVAPGSGAAFARLYDDILDRDPAASPACSRVAVLDGDVIGHALYLPRQIQLAAGDCPGALVGLVVVDERHRGQGVGTVLIEDVHREAATHGIGLLLLAGDPGYYRRFGYHQAFTRWERVVDVADLPAGRNTLRPADASDADWLAALAEVAPPGSVLPSADRWKWLLATGHPRGLIEALPAILGHAVETDACLVDPDGGAVVRIAAGEGQATVYEAATGGTGVDELLAGVAGWCADAGARAVRFRLGKRNALFETAGAPGRVEDPEWQFRVVDLDQVLAGVRPVLERRAEELGDWEREIRLRTPRASLVLGVRSGALDVRLVREAEEKPDSEGLTLPEWGLGRLMLGCDDVLAAVEKAGSPESLRSAMACLFPPHPPTFTLSDAI